MIAQRYKRWRHGRGFGVHSPFAYRVVTDILHPARGCEYYSMKRLNYLIRHYPSRTRRFCRLLFRMAARLPITTLLIPGDHSALPAEVMKNANSRLHFTRHLPANIGSGLLILADPAEVSQSHLTALHTPGVYLFIRNLKSRPGILDAALAARKGGWTFESPDAALIVSADNSALHRTTLNLP